MTTEELLDLYYADLAQKKGWEDTLSDKDRGIKNNFSGTTVIEDCDIKTSGGFDHEWDWRAGN